MYPVSGSRWHGNDNDDVDLRVFLFNGEHANTQNPYNHTVKADTWYHVTYAWTNQNALNSSHVDMYDASAIQVAHNGLDTRHFEVRNYAAAVSPMQLDDATTYTAHFRPYRTTYTLDGNGGKGGHEGPVVDYGETRRLPKGDFKRFGYWFVGWNTMRDGSGSSYDDGAPVGNLSDVSDSEVTLYAQWSPKVYRVTIPTSVTWSAMDVGRVDASAGYDVAVSGDFDGHVAVTGSSGRLSLGGTSIGEETASAESPLYFTAVGSKRDTVSVSGTARMVGVYRGVVGYTVANVE